MCVWWNTESGSLATGVILLYTFKGGCGGFCKWVKNIEGEHKRHQKFAKVACKQCI